MGNFQRKGLPKIAAVGQPDGLVSLTQSVTDADDFPVQVPDSFGISSPVAASHTSIGLTLLLRDTGDLATQAASPSKELPTTGCAWRVHPLLWTDGERTPQHWARPRLRRRCIEQSAPHRFLHRTAPRTVVPCRLDTGWDSNTRSASWHLRNNRRIRHAPSATICL